MKALLWKDFWCNRMIILFALVVVAIPYLIGFAGGFFDDIWWTVDFFRGSALVSMLLSMIVIPMLAGNAIAGERLSRSAEFLVSLPPSRSLIIASKIILALGVSLAIWLTNFLLIYTLGLILGETTEGMTPIVATFVLMFGAAWLSSSFSPSPAVATAFGIIAPILIGSIIYGAYTLLPVKLTWTFVESYNLLSYSGGVLGFVAGTVYFLRRFEP
jgi:ABC-type transport system involved in multi-copper enzyme maturation permease subunit